MVMCVTKWGHITRMEHSGPGCDVSKHLKGSNGHIPTSQPSDEKERIGSTCKDKSMIKKKFQHGKSLVDKVPIKSNNPHILRTTLQSVLWKPTIIGP